MLKIKTEEIKNDIKIFFENSVILFYRTDFEKNKNYSTKLLKSMNNLKKGSSK